MARLFPNCWMIWISSEITDLKRKKIFNIAVEMFQNLYHYTRDLEFENLSIQEARTIELSFGINEVYYLLRTSNLLKSEDETKLKNQIDKINDMAAKELKTLYREVLGNEQFSKKGGAGLGFIDMKKRSGNQLEYKIEPVSQYIKKYTLEVKVEK